MGHFVLFVALFVLGLTVFVFWLLFRRKQKLGQSKTKEGHRCIQVPLMSGNEIRQYREELGQSQEEFARGHGMTLEQLILREGGPTANSEALTYVAIRNLTPQKRSEYRRPIRGLWQRIQLAQHLGVSLRAVDRWLAKQP